MNVHGGAGGKRRVMVVADPGRESVGALDWALSHAVMEQDELILLHVETPTTRRGGGTLSSLLRRPPSTSSTVFWASVSMGANSDGTAAASAATELEFLETMKAECEKKQPRMRVQVERVEMEGKDKAAAIMLQTKVFGIDLLVIGQRRPSSFLGGKLGGGSGRGSGKGTDTAEWLIENSKCLCVGVQKKGQNMGYLLNTRTHKNFWLLA